MINLVLMCMVPSVRVAAILAALSCSLTVQCMAYACEALPDLHIEVTAKFDPAPVRDDYTMADIAALARHQQHDTRRALLGFYTAEFGYTIDLGPEADELCPDRIHAIVTLRLQRRLIEIGREATINACAYAGALRHYRHLAEVDEQTIQRFGLRAAGMLSQAIPSLKLIHPADAADLDATLRKRIRAVVDSGLATLSGARHDAQRAVNSSAELRQLALACSI